MTPTTINALGQRSTIRFDYDPGLVAAVKTIPGKQWDPPTKTWTIPSTWTSALADFIALSSAIVTDPDGRLAPPPPPPDLDAAITAIDIPGTDSAHLHPHQAQFVAAIQAGSRTALLADQPGLGKTASALISLEAVGSKRAIVVVPAVVKTAWEREAARWTPARTTLVLAGRTPTAIPPDADTIIINYDVLSAWQPALTAWQPDALVLDESHYVKDPKSGRGKAAKVIGKSMLPSTLRMAVTGTPIPARPKDLINQLETIGMLPAVADSAWDFLLTYCNGHKNQWGWDFDGASNLGQLHDLLVAGGMVRRLKTDVLDLPSKTVANLPVTLTGAGAKAVKTAQKALMGGLVATAKTVKSETKEPKITPAICRTAASRFVSHDGISLVDGVRQAIGLAKVPLVVDEAKSILEAGESVVIMAHHLSVQEAIVAELAAAGVVRVFGKQSQAQKQDAIDSFQRKDPAARVLVGSIMAAATGITLTAASNMVIAELPWTAAVQEQAIDRIHRITQDSPVTAWRLIATGTMDDQIASLIARRAGVSGAIVDGVAIEANPDARSQVDVLTEMLVKHFKLDVESKEEEVIPTIDVVPVPVPVPVPEPVVVDRHRGPMPSADAAAAASAIAHRLNPRDKRWWPEPAPAPEPELASGISL